MADPFSHPAAYAAYVAEARARDPRLTDWRDGSANDALAGAAAEAADEVDRIAAQRFRDSFVATAEGSALDNVITDRLPGLTRKPAAAATTTLTVTRTSYVGAYTILDGTLATGTGADGRAVTFEVDGAVVIASGDTSASVPVVCAATGPDGNVAAGTLTAIAGLPGGFTVTQPDRAAGGADIEAPDDYRARYRLTRQGGGNGRVQDLEAAALGVQGVSFAFVDESAIAEEDGGYVAVVVGDSTGQGNSTMAGAVATALGRLGSVSSVRAGGVEVVVLAADREELAFTLTAKVVAGRSPGVVALQNAADAYMRTLKPGQVWYADACEAYIRRTVGPDGTRVRSLVMRHGTDAEKAPTQPYNSIRLADPTDVAVTIIEVA